MTAADFTKELFTKLYVGCHFDTMHHDTPRTMIVVQDGHVFKIEVSLVRGPEDKLTATPGPANVPPARSELAQMLDFEARIKSQS